VHTPTALEICAGAGGQALGLELAGFSHAALIEIDELACETLNLNRPLWNVIHGDVQELDGTPYQGIDLLAGGIPCPPFSVAGKQLGEQDDRDLFPSVIRLTRQIRPLMLMVENVRGLLATRFESYRGRIRSELNYIGYSVHWRLLNASSYGVPQLRPRSVLIAVNAEISDRFVWPTPSLIPPKTVGEVLVDLMGSRGWPGAEPWSYRAADIAPTIVGGSSKHGGPDLGPVRARRAWEKLGVDGLGIADLPPEPEFLGNPKLTTKMVARLQGFPDVWEFAGRKTRSYRQVGNAFPPPVARAVGVSILDCLGTSQLSLMDA
jgi:DNA (cytosine-5)-methyltransferase 1